MAMDRLVKDLREGSLGKVLPSLKLLCSSFDQLPTANALGFDPFLCYGELYRKARQNLQAVCNEEAESICDSNINGMIYAVTTAVYLPRSVIGMKHVSRVSKDLHGLAVEGRIPENVGKLMLALESNNFSCVHPTSNLQMMSLQPSTDRYHVFASSLAMHFAAIIESSDAAVSPFARYAKYPGRCKKEDGEFILSVPSNELNAAVKAAAVRSGGHANRAAKCECGFMYLIGNCGQAGSSMPCPQCTNQLGGSNHTLNKGQSDVQNDIPDSEVPGYVVESEDTPFHMVRTLQALPYRVLHLLVHLSMFSGALLGYNGLDSLIQETEDPAEYCWDIVVHDLRLLPPFFGGAGEEAVCAWLHAILQKLTNFCLHQNKSLKDASTREAWENAFAKELVTEHVASSRQSLLDRPLDAIEHRPLILRLINEDPALKNSDKVLSSGLFSTVVFPTFDALQVALARLRQENGGIDPHPFISFLIEEIDLLSLVQHLWPFLQWERVLRETWGSRLERGEAQEMTIENLIEKTSPEKKASISNAFAMFSAAWDGVIHLLRSKNPKVSNRYAELCDCHPVKPDDIHEMTLDSPATIGCIDPEVCSDPAGNLFRIFLHLLSKAQNDLLGMIVPMVPLCDSLQALSLGGNAVWLDTSPQVSLLKFQRQHSLLEDINHMKSKMLEYTLAQTGYGLSGIQIDFKMMESSMATNLLTGSRLIDVNSDDMARDGRMSKLAPPIFLFKGELLHQHRDLPRQLIKQLSQEPVHNARSLKEDPFLQENINCRETINLLDLVMFHATKSRPNPNETLKSYCQAFNLVGGNKEARGRVLQCAAIGSVPLKQLSSLYEIVESIVADAILPTLPKVLPGKYCAPLPSIDMVDKACFELGRGVMLNDTTTSCLEAAAIKAGGLRLEPALKRFIYRELKESAILQNATLDSPLYYQLLHPSFPWSAGENVTDEEVEAAFPDDGDPAFKHAFAIWEELKRRGD